MYKRQVENADDGLMYYMEGIYVDDDSVTVEIIDSDDNIYSGSIDFKDTDFLKQTITEIIVKGHNLSLIHIFRILLRSFLLTVILYSAFIKLKLFLYFFGLYCIL